VRRVHGRWWDLDSLRSGPRLISEAELGANLEEVRGRGFTVFAVRSAGVPLPEPLRPPTMGTLHPHQFFLSNQQLAALSAAPAPDVTQIGAPGDAAVLLSDSSGQGGKPAARRRGVDWPRIAAVACVAVVVIGAVVGVAVLITGPGL